MKAALPSLVVIFTLLAGFAAFGWVRKRYLLALVAISFATLSCVGCGGGGDDDGPAPTPDVTIDAPACATPSATGVRGGACA